MLRSPAALTMVFRNKFLQTLATERSLGIVGQW